MGELGKNLNGRLVLINIVRKESEIQPYLVPIRARFPILLSSFYLFESYPGLESRLWNNFVSRNLTTVVAHPRVN